MALTADLQAEHLSAPQSFSLRPSAAAENVFARIQQARQLHHEPPNAVSTGAPLASDVRITRPLTADALEPAKPLTLSGEGPSIRACSPPLFPPFGGNSEAQSTVLVCPSPRQPVLQSLALQSLPSPSSPLSSPTSLASMHSLTIPHSLPPSRSALHLPLGQPMPSRSISPPASPPTSPTTNASSTKRQARPASETARKTRQPRTMHRSVSPDTNQRVERQSRPNSFGSSYAEVSAIHQVREALPQQLAISPRREQSALVSQMVVAESGGALAGGSVKALLEWAVKTRDRDAQVDLLFTFRLCAPAEELFAAWGDMATDPLYKSRLLQFLRLWLSGYFVMDFRRKPLFSRMLRTVESRLSTEDVTNLKLLSLNANFRFYNTGLAALRKQAVERMLVAAGGLLSTQAAVSMDSLPESMLAEQLTLIGTHLYRNICASEVVDWVLRAQRTEESAPHLTEIIAYSACLSAWVSTEAVKGTPLARLVGLGQRLQVLGNYEALRAVVTGLQHRAVVRLQAAWAALPSDCLAAFDALEDLLSATGDFQLYRQTLKLRGNAATVPMLSVCLHDLTVAYQRGVNGCLLPNGMLSAAFVARAGGPMRELLQFQRNEAYTITMHPAIVNGLLNVKTLNEDELAALAPQPPKAEPKQTLNKSNDGETEGRPKGLRRALSARSLNGFLADLIRKTDEPAVPKDKDVLTMSGKGEKEKERDKDRPTP